MRTRWDREAPWGSLSNAELIKYQRRLREGAPERGELITNCNAGEDENYISYHRNELIADLDSQTLDKNGLI